ncbi:MAG: DUF2971 domain-containing protein [Prevotella sp.]|nr:DUF2971 domain-containing protein [Prevotella sp.]
MGKSILYKYLDAKGGLMMLYYSNLQFTNATKFNDPFDCHPALFDFSNVPETKYNWPPKDFLKLKGETDMENQRNNTWISCFSKVYDSLLMWAYYNGHKGVCIGLNKEALLECLQYKFFGLYFPFAEEVKYKDIIPKVDYFNEHPSWLELLTTKAKDWEHEQEVRLITIEPAWIDAKRCIPDEFKGEELVDGKEIRHYPSISSDCFESLYLGIKISKEDKEKLIKVAKKLNPNIKIYQMTIDPDALRLKGEIIES